MKGLPDSSFPFRSFPLQGDRDGHPQGPAGSPDRTRTSHRSVSHKGTSEGADCALARPEGVSGGADSPGLAEPDGTSEDARDALKVGETIFVEPAPQEALAPLSLERRQANNLFLDKLTTPGLRQLASECKASATGKRSALITRLLNCGIDFQARLAGSPPPLR